VEFGLTTVAAQSGGGSGAHETSIARATRPEPRAIAAVLSLSLLLGLAFLWYFYRSIVTQHLHSRDKPEDWGHAYVIPLISGWIIWQRRREIGAAAAQFAGRAFWPALAPLLLFVLCYVFFLVGFPNHMFAGFTIIGGLGSVLLLLTGPSAFRKMFLPLLYLVFAFTISEAILNKITFPLQLVASQGATLMLKIAAPIFGYTADVDGNTITIIPSKGAPIPLNVAEACSGMRMVIAFFALAGAVALFSCRFWWQRIALMLLAAPVAVLMNTIRVAVLGLASLYNPALASGDAHMFIGTLLLIPGLGLFMACVWSLERAIADPGQAKKQKQNVVRRVRRDDATTASAEARP